MDEMIIRTKFMKGLIARIIGKEVKKKFGCDIGIQIDKLSLENDDKMIRLKLDVSAEMPKEDLTKLVKSATD